ncbi:hypothetical protein GCG21_15925 [Pseudactinotalea sp. HY160]|nr:hypothetical protein [Pseudactinotalea sp. HY160]
MADVTIGATRPVTAGGAVPVPPSPSPPPSPPPLSPPPPGGTVNGGVVTVTVLPAPSGLTFPTRSVAKTAYEYCIPAASPVSVTDSS